MLRSANRRFSPLLPRCIFRSYGRDVLRSCQYIGHHHPTTADTTADAYIVNLNHLNLLREETASDTDKPVFLHLEKPANYIDQLESIITQNLTGFLLSGIKTELEIHEFDAKLRSDIENGRKRFELISVIDNYNLRHCERIARVARNVALVADLSMTGQNGLDFCFPVVTAARDCRLVPVFSRLALVEDSAENMDFRNLCSEVKKYGFEGIVTLNNDETLIANQTFSVSETEAKIAEHILNHHEKGVRTYQRSINDRPVHIGIAQLSWARKTIAQAAKQPSNTANSSTVQPSNTANFSTVQPSNTANFSTVQPSNTANFSTVQPSNTANFSTVQPSNTANFSTVRVDASPGRQDLSQIRVGDVVPSYQEITTTSSQLALWESAFINTNSVTSSRQFCRALGLRDRLVPFDFVVARCIGGSIMRLSEPARVHLGCYNAVQHRPLYLGETVNSHYTLQSVTQTSTGEVASSLHSMTNQDGEVIITVEKRALFERNTFSKDTVEMPAQTVPENKLKATIINNYRTSSNVPRILAQKQGDVYVHRFMKVYGHSESRALANLFTASNSFHHDPCRYREEDLLVMGITVGQAAISNLLLDYGDILYQECLSSNILNRINMGDMISTISCVLDIRDVPENDALEELTLKVFGVLNMDPVELQTVTLPEKILTNYQLRPREIEQALAETCPSLFHRLASVEVRRILRDKNAKRITGQTLNS